MPYIRTSPDNGIGVTGVVEEASRHIEGRAQLGLLHAVHQWLIVPATAHYGSDSMGIAPQL